jgi:transposase-like protein
MSIENVKLEIKPYSTKELAAIYKVSEKTIYRWLKPFKEQIGQKNGRLYTVNQVRTIIEMIGLPGVVK